MSDDMSKGRPQDASRINLSEDDEVAYWTGALSVTIEELRVAVDEVGDSSAAVQNYLNRQDMSTR